MGYKDYYSNLEIHPKRMTFMDHFSSGHYCELREMFFLYQSLHSGHYCELRETNHSSNLHIHPKRIVVHGTSTICQPRPLSTGRMFVYQQSVNLDHSLPVECLSNILTTPLAGNHLQH
jgi:hypothetical protein